MTGKKLAPKHNDKIPIKSSKYKQIVCLTTIKESGKNTVLNNELNVKFDFVAIANELQAAVISFNKTLFKL